MARQYSVQTVRRFDHKLGGSPDQSVANQAKRLAKWDSVTSGQRRKLIKIDFLNDQFAQLDSIEFDQLSSC